MSEKKTNPEGDSSEPVVQPAEKQGAARESHEVSLLFLGNVLLRHRKLMALVPLSVAVVVVIFSLVFPRTYTSTASFTPQAGQAQASRLAGLASQFGINVPQGQAGQSPQFYADLLRGRELLRRAVVSPYRIPSDTDGTDEAVVEKDLVALWEIQAKTRPLAVARAIDALRGRAEVSSTGETGVVELSVSTRWPQISQQIAERMIELVNRFNLETRRTQAEAEREFIESQVARAESALYAAEDSLEAFLERHRRYENSPDLTFQHDRLQRRVSLHQQVFTSLSESYEQAKIDEVRNTPVITVVEPPELPARPDRRRLLLKGILGLVLGGMIGLFWAFGREMLATSRKRDPDHYAEFRRLREEARKDIRELWERLRRISD